MSLSSIILKLQQAAGEYDIKEIQWPMNDAMFAMKTIKEFKETCNGILNKIILVKAPKKIKNDIEKNELLEKLWWPLRSEKIVCQIKSYILLEKYD